MWRAEEKLKIVWIVNIQEQTSIVFTESTEMNILKNQRKWRVSAQKDDHFLNSKEKIYEILVIIQLRQPGLEMTYDRLNRLYGCYQMVVALLGTYW